MLQSDLGRVRGTSTAPQTKPSAEEPVQETAIAVASQWTLMWLRFRKHKLALISVGILAILYVGAIFCEFLSPYDSLYRSPNTYSPPQRIHFIRDGQLHRPFVYGLKMEPDPKTFQSLYTEDTTKVYPIRFLYHGVPYKWWGLFRTNVHLVGVDKGAYLFLMGTDELGRDLFSRILYASRISLSVGIVGVAIGFVIGCVLGGISGYFGGAIDTVIQRGIEFLISVPSIPLWMALSASLPPQWPPLKIYFGITLILSLVGWGGLARTVRGKILQLREEDFVLAARLAGTSEWTIITSHLIPSFASYLIVNVTLAIPGMILGETALSFLNLGLRPPVVSWGVLLQKAQNMLTITLYPWLLIPCVFVILTVLALNFIGDGMRDAADPYAV